MGKGIKFGCYIYIWLGWLVGTSVKSRISEELHRGGTGRRGTGDKGEFGLVG